MVRISTATIFDLGIKGMQQQTSDLVKLNQQIATGRRILTPKDDPIGSSRALELSQSVSLNKQYDTNTDSATSSLGLEENTLISVGNLLHSVRTVAVHAGNGALSRNDLLSLATELRGDYKQLLGLANTADGNGQYMFSGYQGATIPFAETAPGNVVYNGDEGQRLVQVTTSRQIPVNDPGSDVFMRIKNGNGTFVTAAPVDPLTKISTNTGTGIISSGNVLDPTKWAAAGNNKDFTIKFAVSATVPPVTTYDIIDNVSGNSLLTGAAPGAAPYPRIYTDGSTISLKSQGAEPPFDYGVELSIQGAPATGDTFTVKASTNESIFTTLNDLITTLENANVPTGSTSLTNNLNTALTNFDNDLNQILTVRSSIGARMNEVTAVKNTGQDIALQYQETLSGLQDLDYTKALSEFSLKQIALTAAQKSFVSVQGLSLFNYIQ